MSATAATPPAAALIASPFRALPWLARCNLLAVALLAAALTALLWPHWRDNADLSHAFFMPAIFLYLLHEARTGTPRFISSSRTVTLGASALLLLALLALIASGLYAAALDWTHSLVACTLTIAFAGLLAASLVVFASARVRFLPLNWPACAAVGLWLLSTPIPPGTYTQLTLRLQLMVTENVLRALHLLGIAASRSGNVIDLATTSVGVEEACSGIRSLVSCLFAGILFSATLVRRPWARALLIALAGPLAIAMNFFRSLTLTLLANAGIDISGTWHDVTGFAVLGLTALLLGALALLLARGETSFAQTQNSKPAPAAPAAPSTAAHRLLAAGLAVAVALAIFFYANTRPSLRQSLPVPNLAAILPTHADGWHVETARDLYQFSATLHTDHLAQRTYLRSTPHGVEQLTVYLAYWRPGQAPVSLVASHTPDACWPGSGWTPAVPEQTRAALPISGYTLPEAEARLFKSGDFPQYVWFWHLYDGRPIAFRDPYSARALLAIAWHYGFTHDGDQLFVRVSSNRPWSAFAQEPLLREIFSRLQPLGL